MLHETKATMSNQISKNNKSVEVGTVVRFTHSHLMQEVHFTAKVVKLDGKGSAWVEMPEKIRKLPFPPLGGKRFGLYPINSLIVKEEAKKEEAKAAVITPEEKAIIDRMVAVKDLDVPDMLSGLMYSAVAAGSSFRDVIDVAFDNDTDPTHEIEVTICEGMNIRGRLRMTRERVLRFNVSRLGIHSVSRFLSTYRGPSWMELQGADTFPISKREIVLKALEDAVEASNRTKAAFNRVHVKTSKLPPVNRQKAGSN